MFKRGDRVVIKFSGMFGIVESSYKQPVGFRYYKVLGDDGILYHCKSGSVELAGE